MTCWTFLAAPSPLAFWARRQAHETAIHRVDAQLAEGTGPAGLDPFAPGLARDGIDELIMGFGRRRSKRGLRSDPPRWLAVHARPSPDRRGDGGETGEVAHWAVCMGTDSAGVARGMIPADDVPDGTGCDVTGPAQALYLLLWNRGGTEGLGISGDPRGLGVWREQVSVRWSGTGQRPRIPHTQPDPGDDEVPGPGRPDVRLPVGSGARSVTSAMAPAVNSAAASSAAGQPEPAGHGPPRRRPPRLRPGNGRPAP